MVAKVWYVDRNVRSRYSMIDKLEVLWKKTSLGDMEKGDRVCIKTHFGSYGNTNYVRPVFIRKMVDLVKEKGGSPVVCESCGLGYGMKGIYGGRSTGPDYLKMAALHGYTIGSLQAPIYMLDGYMGTDVFEVEINGKHIKKVYVGMGLRDFDYIVIFSHFKGHAIGGIGGAIKNLGVGCVGKKSKALMHTDGNIEIIEEKCLGEKCGKCAVYCPVRCIDVKDVAVIDKSKCILCLHCSSVCRNLGYEAVKVGWNELEEQALRLAENAKGVLDSIGREKFVYLNFALDISQMCDCVSFGPPPIVQDLGIFVSNDPVAIDKACLDMVNASYGLPNSAAKDTKPGDDKFKISHEKNAVTHLIQLNHAEEIGLGTQKYELLNVDEKPQS